MDLATGAVAGGSQQFGEQYRAWWASRTSNRRRSLDDIRPACIMTACEIRESALPRARLLMRSETAFGWLEVQVKGVYRHGLGLLGLKVGMTQVYDDKGKMAPVTVLGRALPGPAGPQPGARRLRRRAARLPGQARRKATRPSAATSPPSSTRKRRKAAPERRRAAAAQGQLRAAALHPRVPSRQARPTSRSARMLTAAEVFKDVAARRRHRHQQGPRHHRRHEAAQLRTACAASHGVKKAPPLSPAASARTPATAAAAGPRRATAWPAVTAHERVTIRNLHVVRIDAENQPRPRQGGRPRAQRRPGHGPADQQEAARRPTPLRDWRASVATLRSWSSVARGPWLHIHRVTCTCTRTRGPTDRTLAMASGPGKLVGIDLGTTFSRHRHPRRPRPGRHPAQPRRRDAHAQRRRSSTTAAPSSARPPSTSPSNSPTASPLMVKRRMGHAVYGHPVAGRDFRPETLSAIILRKLVQDAEQRIGPISKAVITVPAYFDDTRRKATKDAGRIAGLDVLDILDEPTAAALAYSLPAAAAAAAGRRPTPLPTSSRPSSSTTSAAARST